MLLVALPARIERATCGLGNLASEFQLSDLGTEAFYCRVSENAVSRK